MNPFRSLLCVPWGGHPLWEVELRVVCRRSSWWTRPLSLGLCFPICEGRVWKGGIVPEDLQVQTPVLQMQPRFFLKLFMGHTDMAFLPPPCLLTVGSSTRGIGLGGSRGRRAQGWGNSTWGGFRSSCFPVSSGPQWQPLQRSQIRSAEALSLQRTGLGFVKLSHGPRPEKPSPSFPFSSSSAPGVGGGLRGLG